MTLYNPFFKFLNPRNSGLIAFKGGGDGASASEVQTIVTDATAPIVTAGSAINANLGTATEGGVVQATGGTMTMPTTSIDAETGEVISGTKTVDYCGGDVAVTDTVKGDTEGLLAGQSDLSSQVSSGFANFQPVNVTNTTIDTSNLAKSAAMDAGFAASSKNQDAIRLDLAGIGQDTKQIGDIKTDVGTIKGDTAKIGGIATDLGTVKTGVADANTALGGLKTDVAGVQTGVDTANTNIGLLGQDVSEGFAGQKTQVADMQSAVLGGQATMSDILNAMRDEATTYYGDLSAGQTTIQDSVGGVQTGLDSLRTDQQKANTLADQQRAELAKTVTGGFDTVQNKQNDASQEAFRNAAQAQVNASNIQKGQADIQQQTGTFADTAKQISSGAAGDTNNVQQQDFVNRLDTIKQILTAQGTNLDASIRSEYTTLANAFDEQGQLITQSVDQNGNQIRRGLDEQNMLITNSYNAQGQLAAQQTTNINQLMSALDTMGYRQQGSQFGDLSANGLGIMSAQQNQPFIRQDQPIF
jgi:hypothetical protein